MGSIPSFARNGWERLKLPVALLSLCRIDIVVQHTLTHSLIPRCVLRTLVHHGGVVNVVSPYHQVLLIERLLSG
jgi:hypothetical protein